MSRRDLVLKCSMYFIPNSAVVYVSYCSGIHQCHACNSMMLSGELFSILCARSGKMTSARSHLMLGIPGVYFSFRDMQMLARAEC